MHLGRICHSLDRENQITTLDVKGSCILVGQTNKINRMKFERSVADTIK